ncbi:hypothetical protein WJX73_007826 [Symbiochloris irregularis]|uniref:Uncharacterized protein n=1 Tax=Symbiochloris irregularis TaxID=706552 RepID=A0AAW1NMT7_9CHLO
MATEGPDQSRQSLSQLPGFFSPSNWDRALQGVLDDLDPLRAHVSGTKTDDSLLCKGSVQAKRPKLLQTAPGAAEAIKAATFGLDLTKQDRPNHAEDLAAQRASPESCSPGPDTGSDTDGIAPRWQRRGPLTLEEALAVQHLRLNEAAEACGLRPTAFKKKCRALGIQKHNYRQLQSLQKAQQRIKEASEGYDCDSQTAKASLNFLRKAETTVEVTIDPETGQDKVIFEARALTSNDTFKRVRQATYKHQSRINSEEHKEWEQEQGARSGSNPAKKAAQAPAPAPLELHEPAESLPDTCTLRQEDHGATMQPSPQSPMQPALDAGRDCTAPASQIRASSIDYDHDDNPTLPPQVYYYDTVWTLAANITAFCNHGTKHEVTQLKPVESMQALMVMPLTVS